MDDKIEIENVNTPGRSTGVNRVKFEAMLKALLQVMPVDAPAITVAEVKAALLPLLPQDVFPGGATSGWLVAEIGATRLGGQVCAEAAELETHADLPR